VAWKTDQLVNVVRSPVTPAGTTPVNSFEPKIEIDRPIVPGEGRIIVYDDNDNIVATINSDDPRLTYA
jgi:hypothetical protein